VTNQRKLRSVAAARADCISSRRCTLPTSQAPSTPLAARERAQRAWSVLHRPDVDALAGGVGGLELDDAVHEGEEGVVGAALDVDAGSVAMDTVLRGPQ
jgi:hypothetical protein